MIYIITGGPGFGKSILIDQLAQHGFLCGKEFAREVIEEQESKGGEILPWQNAALFQEQVKQQRLTFYRAVPSDVIAFSDRGLVDQIAFSRFHGKVVDKQFLTEVKNHPYAPTVFITPVWAEIYTTDNVRKESFEQAVAIHECVLKTYSEMGYRLIELPKVAVEKRAAFILKVIKLAE